MTVEPATLVVTAFPTLRNWPPTTLCFGGCAPVQPDVAYLNEWALIDGPPEVSTLAKPKNLQQNAQAITSFSSRQKV